MSRDDRVEFGDVRPTTRMGRALWLLSAATALSLSVVGASHASLLYSQPLTTTGGPYSYSVGQQVADDFSIAGGGLIDEVVWWGENYNRIPFGTLRVQFLADSGAGPGAILATSIVTPTIVATGVLDTYGNEILKFTASIPMFAASPGATYFFSVFEDQANFVWAESNLGVGKWITFDGGTTWGDYRDDRDGSSAYQLHSTGNGQVPEPESLLLVALGLAGLGLSRRKSR